VGRRPGRADGTDPCTAAHVLHYASTCFEGFKAYRCKDGSINVFPHGRHIERMRQSARLLFLPVPTRRSSSMILQTIDALHGRA
jgi:branched-chain amino acid aminotransferase